MFLATFFEPILAGKLQLEYGFNSDQVANFYSICTIATFISNLLLAVLPIKKHFLIWIALNSILIVLSLFLMGPSRLFQIPDNLMIMGIGMGLLGLTCQVYRVVMTVVAI